MLEESIPASRSASLRSRFLPFIGILVFLLANGNLIRRTLLAPELREEIPWFVTILAVILCVYLCSILSRNRLWAGLAALGTGALVFAFAFLTVTYTSRAGPSSKTAILALILLSTVLLGPVLFLSARMIGSKPVDYADTRWRTRQGWPGRLSGSAVAVLSIGAALAILGVFLAVLFYRAEALLVGWDTPGYVFRSRLVESYGFGIHAEIGGGYQIAFPLLSSIVHHLTGLPHLEVVRILPAVLMALTCLSTGYLVYRIARSWYLMILAILFTAATGLAAWLVSDLRDNLTVLLAGTWVLISATRATDQARWPSQVAQGLLLVLTGLSHLTLSSIFFITILSTNLIELYDGYFQGGRTGLGRLLWRAIRVPLLSGIVVIAVWGPAVPEFVRSLGLGLQVAADTSAIRPNTAAFMLDRYNLAINLPWLALGLVGTLWMILGSRTSRGYRVIFVWSITCLYLGVVLSPVTYLSDRFLAMAPFGLLIALAFHWLWVAALQQVAWQRVASQTLLVLVILGMLFPSNMLTNAESVAQRYSVPQVELEHIQQASQYIAEGRAAPPFIFLVQDSSPYAASYSALWRFTLLALLPDQALTETYVYFGRLEHLLRNEPTPPEALGLAGEESEIGAEVSSSWFDLLAKDNILENPRMTIFILEDYNPDTFKEYLFSPSLDEIASGLLVLHVPEDLEHPGDEARKLSQ